MTWRRLSGPPSCINLPPSRRPSTRTGANPSLLISWSKSAQASVVVPGVEHDLAAVAVARIGAEVTGGHRVERLDDRRTGEVAGDPFAAGFLAEVDIAAVDRCVFSELVGGVDHDPPAPIRDDIGELGYPQERQRQNHEIGLGRLLHGHGLGCITEISH